MSDPLDTSLARKTILATISNTLGADSKSLSARQKTMEARLKKHERGPIPARGQKPLAERIKLFAKQVEKTAGTITHVKKASDASQAIADYLKSHNLKAEIRLGSDPRLDALDWKRIAVLKINHGPAQDSDKITVTYALSGIAETGTLLLVSGPDNPTSLNFMPDHHIALVDAKTIDAAYEDGFDMLRKQYGAKKMPRVVNFITGPSRTADIEQKINFGAHGPKHLHVIIIG